LNKRSSNGIDDEDGCPDEDPNAGARVRGGKVEIKEQVFFETSKTVIKQESFRILDEVARLLISNPQIGNLEIEGHTDDRGDEKLNKELSQGRAQSVADYLVGKGVDRNRITPFGYGEERPIADNNTSEGRAKNRRVEFTIRGLPPEDPTKKPK
jgi:OOP family OmpA-OmpF porin